MEFAFAMAAAAYMLFTIFNPATKGLGFGYVDTSIVCDIHHYYFECSGHPNRFYTVSIFLSALLFLFSGVLSFISIIWVSCPCLHSISRVVDRQFGESEARPSQDTRFLLNLLGLASGPAPAIKAMAILNKVQFTY